MPPSALASLVDLGSETYLVLALVLGVYFIAAAVFLFHITYVRAPRRILDRLAEETCHHFIATKHLPSGVGAGEADVVLLAQPPRFTKSGCWPHPAVYLYLGHKKRGSKLNGRLGDRNDSASSLTLVSLRGSDVLAGIDPANIKWRRRDDAIALINSNYSGRANLIHGVSHSEIRSQRVAPFSFSKQGTQ